MGMESIFGFGEGRFGSVPGAESVMGRPERLLQFRPRDAGKVERSQSRFSLHSGVWVRSSRRGKSIGRFAIFTG
jgi:hypothetical protein